MTNRREVGEMDDEKMRDVEETKDEDKGCERMPAATDRESSSFSISPSLLLILFPHCLPHSWPSIFGSEK